MTLRPHPVLTRRDFIQAVAGGGAAMGLHSFAGPITADNSQLASFDVIVVGGTPGGIAASVAVARLGRRVALVERHDHLGGMTSSGLGKSDIEHREMIQGLFAEFIGRVRQHYVETYGNESKEYELCRDGYYFEPSVAEAVFDQLVAEQTTLTVLRGYQLESVLTQDGSVQGVRVRCREDGQLQALTAPVVIDATYEGDVYAKAGADFRLGRESRDTFDEPHAGVVYFDYQNQLFLDGTTGEASDRLPAYTYRLCLTTDPDNSHRLDAPPPDYNRERYIGYFDDLRAGRLAAPKSYKPGRGYNAAHFDTLVRVLSVTDIPNRKTDVNMNPRPLAFPFAEEHAGYVEGDWATRRRIETDLRNLTLGLVWFLQNDAEVPAAHREIANQYHWPLDEFADNDHFPFQLYVREARRLVGEYMLTEHDVTQSSERSNTGRFDDAIAVGEFPIDSFP
ncbi:MAG: FAD-dependent oxidoreductase, partial [Planctomycetaceae bacterium]|nr:FAD-dependent oxidoreductase [Planctomycetaceae bacterium]